MRVADLVNFIKARERHRVAKERGGKIVRPDPIISQYRFCNVRRNDDRVTKWIFENYLDRWRDHKYLWFALVMARLFNNEGALSRIKPLVLPFKPESIREHLHERTAEKLKNFNAAYIVSTNGRAMNKVDYVIDHVLQPLWDNRKKLARDMDVGQLANVYLVLSNQNGLGSFMAAQVIADWKYADPNKWEDFNTFAASGPGSRRGMNRVLGLPISALMSEAAFRERLSVLRDAVNKRLSMLPLTAQDVQNCLCEFDKYERVRLGEGRPKQRYPQTGVIL